MSNRLLLTGAAALAAGLALVAFAVAPNNNASVEAGEDVCITFTPTTGPSNTPAPTNTPTSTATTVLTLNETGDGLQFVAYRPGNGSNGQPEVNAGAQGTPQATCEATDTPTRTNTPGTSTSTSTPPAAATATRPPATNTPTGGSGAGTVTPPSTGTGGSDSDVSMLWLAAGAALIAVGGGALAFGVKRRG